jgi:hypothetical protein
MEQTLQRKQRHGDHNSKAMQLQERTTTYSKPLLYITHVAETKILKKEFGSRSGK